MERVLAFLLLSLVLSLIPSTAGTRERYRFILKHRDAPTSPFLQGHENLGSFLQTGLRRDEERAESIREHLLRGRARLATGAATERRGVGGGSPPAPRAGAVLLPPAGAGEYYTELYVGTPRQMLVAMVDLASDVVWLPTESESFVSSEKNLLASENAVSTVSAFSPWSSSSFTPVPSRSPADAAAEFAYEDIHLNETELRRILVSLSEVDTPRAAILGVGRGQTIAPRLAYCLSDTDEPAGSSLVFNGGDAVCDLDFTPLLPHSTFHLVTLAAIKVHHRELPVPAVAVVLDMSMRFSRLPRAVLEQIVSAIARRVALPRVAVPGFPLCYVVGSTEILRVPEVEFVFETGARMRLPMENLFVAASERGEVVCLAMTVGEDVAVIGATQQQNFVVVVDRAGEQVGFAPRQCASLPNL